MGRLEGSPLKVSIVVPVLNAPENLERLLTSVARVCAGQPYEVLVCDNGSSDGTVEVARRLGARVLSLPGETIAGLRNRGAEVACGSVLAFVDSDCEVLPGWLEAGCLALEAPGVVAAGCWPPPPLECTWVQELVSLGARLNPPVGRAAWIPSMNLFVHRAAFERVGGFDARLRTCEDVDLCYRLRDQGGALRWDMRIVARHYGEPDSLRRLFQKERWHGLDNYSGMRHHGLRLEELPGLVMPPVLLGSLLLPGGALLGMPLLTPLPALLTLPMLGLMPTLALLRAGRSALKIGRPTLWMPLSLVQGTYLLARVAAVLK